MNPDRKLVTVRVVKSLTPIEGADVIELATIDGWPVVVRKGEFQPGDPAVYFEIDSFLPAEDSRFHFLLKGGCATMGEFHGHHLRTARLQGQLSQGLALPVTKFPDVMDALQDGTIADLDLDALLHVVPYEADIPDDMKDVAKGSLPIILHRASQERVQNVPEVLNDHDAVYERTMKLHGETMTIYHYNGAVGVCGANWEFKPDADHRMPQLARAMGLYEVLRATGRNLAVQGEFMGPGVQKNREKLVRHEFFTFAIYDIDRREYLPPTARAALYRALREELTPKQADLFHHVPVLADVTRIAPSTTMQDLLLYVEGPSINHAYREGEVWVRRDGKGSFKAISNKFLLKAQ